MTRPLLRIWAAVSCTLAPLGTWIAFWRVITVYVAHVHAWHVWLFDVPLILLAGIGTGLRMIGEGLEDWERSR